MSVAKRIVNRKYLCKSAGVVAPRAICGAVSVFSDDKGHRCMAHGNVKCKHKVELLTDENGVSYEKGGQYIDEEGNVCFLDYIDEGGLFAIHDGESDFYASTLSVSEFTSGKVYTS